MKPVHLQESALCLILSDGISNSIFNNVCGSTWEPNWDIANFQVDEKTKEINPDYLNQNVKVTCPKCIEILKSKGL